MNETRILIRLLRMYFPRNWEFGSALSKLRNFGGFEPPHPWVVTVHFQICDTCWYLQFKIFLVLKFPNLLLNYVTSVDKSYLALIQDQRVWQK
jgi:hypothetical protein